MGKTMLKMLRDQIKIVQQGGEPMALVRDPEKNGLIEFITLQGTPDEGTHWVEMLEKRAI